MRKIDNMGPKALLQRGTWGGTPGRGVWLLGSGTVGLGGT
jgi:hypothetical protein